MLHAATLARQSPCPMLEPPVRAFPVFTVRGPVRMCCGPAGWASPVLGMWTTAIRHSDTDNGVA